MTAVITSPQSTSRAHRKVVRETYERVARNPCPFPLHRGPYYVRRFLGYPEAYLVGERLPTGERKGAPSLWKHLLQSAPSAEELLELATRAGLNEVQAVACYDCLRDAPISEMGRGMPRVHGLTLFAIR